MLNFKEEIARILAEKIDSLSAEAILPLIETPPSETMGDFAFPVFSLAKIYRKNPAVIAQDIAKTIDDPLFEKVDTASAYINFFLNKDVLAKEILGELYEKGEHFGRVDIGHGKNVVLDYSSPNIAKPFHIGHIRTTLIGDAIKRIYQFLGYNTIAYNHLGDYGTQFGKLIVAIDKWGDKEAIQSNPIRELLKLYVKINEEADKDENLLAECRYWFKELEEGNPRAVELWKWIRDVSLEEFERVYKMLGIEFDTYKGESFYSDKMPTEVAKMEAKGILQDSQGAKIVNLDKYDLQPALIIKSDGTTIYLTRDVATAVYRETQHQPDKLIYVVGSQQILHFKQLKAVLEEMGYDWADKIVHVAFGMVSLKDGTLSTRKGNVVYLEDLLNKAVDKVRGILDEREVERGAAIENKEELAKQVGIGAIKFQELFNSRIKDYTFDWDTTLSFEGETGPYVQYTHARINSLLRRGDFTPVKLDTSRLVESEEVALLKALYNFTDVVVDAHDKYEPFYVTRYITELAKSFNSYYNKTQILVEDEELKAQRLMLVYGVKVVIKAGLALIGMAAPDKM
ncbi:arginine--tRNA ligase [Peptoniphilus equinus]|uniref:Arginine--tRNA ligase n=1 Tax=Peptoniphilus equinus TaxID=3016343 RepID=A0ABY7QWV6_9FIRM|nr:arginine--tRNA ligase [Peptoniphilus equinus]WBW50398.1 arginine--tRNA ligase [Peptoniphilus equinus]